ncbi:MAG: heavy metal translocating P-type ATPase [Blautia sp.]|jgi:Cd2+/Zn2+-exporting ATPase
MLRKIYNIENLDCANCAAKVERKISQLPGVEEATITFATKQLRIAADDPDAMLPVLQRTAASIEPDVRITPHSRARHTNVVSYEEHAKKYAQEASEGHSHSHRHEEAHIHQRPQQQEAACTCGHDHAHGHEEAHSHDHPHLQEAACTCGHDHAHGLEEAHIHQRPQQQETCGCGHAHSSHSHNHAHSSSTADRASDLTDPSSSAGATQKIYLLENLGCANCAAKMETRISELPGVTHASITFATKQLRITAADPDALLDQIQQICASIESEVIVKPKETRSMNPAAPSEAFTPKKKALSENAKSGLFVGAGAAFFIAGEILAHMDLPTAALVVFITAYLILGGKVLRTALGNLSRGHVFDENFLMSIATLGAFVIGEYAEAVGVMLFFRVGELFEHIAVEKSRSQIMDAVDMRPEVVNLVMGDEVRVLDAEEAKVGDILLVRAGDRIPLDGVVTEGESRIDTSPVTGEPVPVKVTPGDDVTSGCVNTSGLLKIRVEKVLEESMVTRILDSVENAAASKPQIDRFITRFARIYTPVVILLAAATAILPSLFTGDWNYWVYTALSFLVMSCPCALVLSVPLAFFSGIGAGSKLGILFKGGVSLEAMTHVDAVVMDKTGTITEGNFMVQQAVPEDGMTEDELLAFCAACELSSTHPIAASIAAAAKEKGLEIPQPTEVEEIAGHGIRAKMDQGEILCGNQKLLEKYHVYLPEHHKNNYGTEVLAAKNGRFIGYLIISDTIKAEAQSAIQAIKKQKITTAMLTGDALESAQAVADKTGIDEVHAKLLPEDKLKVLGEIREKHGAVMFVGDGINDAPVLAGADVGAAMGSGADAAIEAADVVFMTSHMDAIPQSLAISRATNRIAIQNVVFALIIKIAVMILGLAGFASMWLAVFADTGVAMICILNSIRILFRKKI